MLDRLADLASERQANPPHALTDPAPTMQPRTQTLQGVVSPVLYRQDPFPRSAVATRSGSITPG
ncbi:MAG: hypothetical protein ABS955_09530 [Stenotrophomonas maltophilia]